MKPITLFRIIPELALWLLFYFLISCCYRYGSRFYDNTSSTYIFGFSDKRPAKVCVLVDPSTSLFRVFEKLCVFFYTYSDYIPLTFLLGFYVSAVFTRWSQYLDNIGWIDSSALLIATYVRGADETSRKIRRNALRHIRFLYPGLLVSRSP